MDIPYQSDERFRAMQRDSMTEAAGRAPANAKSPRPVGELEQVAQENEALVDRAREVAEVARRITSRLIAPRLMDEATGAYPQGALTPQPPLATRLAESQQIIRRELNAAAGALAELAQALGL